MAEYIEREKLCKSIMRNCRNFEDMKDVEYAGLLVLLEPIADAVEVVRCKDCKYWQRNSGFTESPNGLCSQWCDVLNGYDFCSYGERRLDDESA